MNHSSLGGNNTINNSTNNINNYTQSNINTTNQNKIKERLIQNLKNNFNQERIRRKKMLSVNVNVNLNQHYSMIHNNINDSINNNNNNNSFLHIKHIHLNQHHPQTISLIIIKNQLYRRCTPIPTIAKTKDY